MNRREFLAASAAVAAGLVLGGGLTPALFAADEKSAGSAGSGERQIYELRTYHFASPEKQQAYEQFLAKAGIAALNRAGVEPVGVFKLNPDDNRDLKPAPDPNDLWLFLPHKSFESVLTLESKLAADEAYQNAGKDVLTSKKNDPAFTRYENMLLLAFEGAPKVVVPTRSEGRLFELRTYESHNAERAKNKVEMFNKGEFPVFQRAGMPGVFFGSAIAGPDLPQLTYMIAHEDAGRKAQDWRAFGADAEWKKLSGNPAYKDNVSKIIARFLRPAAGSQI
jgi:hypothetical protein